MHKALHTHPPKPSELSVAAPPALDAIVERAMARRPEDRYLDAAAFATALRQAMQACSGIPAEVVGGLPVDEEATVIAPQHGAPAAQTAPVSPIRRSSLPAIAGVALFAIILVGLGAWLVVAQHEPATTATKVAQVSVSPPQRMPAQHQPGPAPQAVPLSPEPTATQAPQLPQASVPTEATSKPAAGREPSAVSPPTGDARVATPAQSAGVVPPPEELRSNVRDAIAPIRCTLASGDLVRDGSALELKAIVASSSEASLRAAVTSAVPMLPIDWHVETLSEPYCTIVELIRPLVAKFGMVKGSLMLATVDGRTKLLEGDRIVLRINAPNFPSIVQLDDLQSDGSVYHMQPSDGYPASTYEPLSQQTWGDARPGIAEPAVVQAPFGTDMIIAIASPRPLFVERRPPVEGLEVYLRSLRSAIEAAQVRNDDIAATALILTTSKRQ